MSKAPFLGSAKIEVEQIKMTFKSDVRSFDDVSITLQIEELVLKLGDGHLTALTRCRACGRPWKWAPEACTKKCCNTCCPLIPNERCYTHRVEKQDGIRDVKELKNKFRADHKPYNDHTEKDVPGLRSDVLYCVSLRFAMLYCASLCFAVLHCALLCFAVLDCALLCFTVLHCVSPCFTVLWYVLLRFAVL